MTNVEERPVTTVPGMFDPGRTTAAREWWPLAVGGVLVLVVGLLVGRATAPSRQGDDDASTTRTGEELVGPGALLGAIDGSSRYRSNDDVDRYRYAWPGQVLTAPEPSTGDAAGWQWETCDVPPEPSDDEDEAAEEQAPFDCTAVQGATERRWESPPTSRVVLVRAIVTVDLGDGVQVRAATTPIAAVPWPDDITPGDPPPEATPDAPPPDA